MAAVSLVIRASEPPSGPDRVKALRDHYFNLTLQNLGYIITLNPSGLGIQKMLPFYVNYRASLNFFKEIRNYQGGHKPGKHGKRGNSGNLKNCQNLRENSGKTQGNLNFCRKNLENSGEMKNM